MGYSSSRTAPAWVPRGVTSPARSLLQHGLSTGSQPPLGHIPLLQHGVFHGLQVDVCSTINLHGVQGDSLPHHGLPHGLQGNLCSGAWSTSSPSFFTDLGVCRVVSLTYSLSHILSPLSSCNCCCTVTFPLS